MKKDASKMHVNLFILSCIIALISFSYVLNGLLNLGFDGLVKNVFALISFLIFAFLVIYLCTRYAIFKKWDQLDKEEGL